MLYIVNLHKLNESNLHIKHDNGNIWKYSKVRQKYKVELYIDLDIISLQITNCIFTGYTYGNLLCHLCEKVGL